MYIYNITSKTQIKPKYKKNTQKYIYSKKTKN